MDRQRCRPIELCIIALRRSTLTPCARGGLSRFQAYCAWMRPRSGMQRRNCPRAYVRLHGHIPENRGPCSTFRRTLSQRARGKVRCGNGLSSISATIYSAVFARFIEGARCESLRIPARPHESLPRPPRLPCHVDLDQQEFRVRAVACADQQPFPRWATTARSRRASGCRKL